METTPRQTAAPARRRRRWWWSWLILVVLAGSIALARGPRLRAVTVRAIPSNCSLHFSMHGCGYPAVEGPTDTGKGTFDFTARWLNDDGQPHGAPFVLHCGFWAVSPLRNAVAFTTPGGQRAEVGIAWRDGRRETAQLPHRVPKRLTSGDDGRFHDGRELFDRHGSPAVTPPDSLFFAPWVQSLDPRYAVLRHPSSARRPKDLLLVDTVTGQRLWTTTRSAFEAGVVFHAGNRFLLVPRDGLAQCFAGTPPAGGTVGPLPWWWSEDGTVWTVQHGAPRVLSWHQGAPRLRARPQSVTADPHIRRLEHRAGGQYEEYRFLPAPHEASPGMAVADHGRLVAVAETQESLPPALRRLLRPLLPRVPLLQRQRRVLTLYRDQRVLGRHTIALDPRALLTPATTVSLAYGLRAAGYLPAVFAREHLAFNAQNTRLAWVVETKKGKTLYVFAVPQVR